MSSHIKLLETELDMEIEYNRSRERGEIYLEITDVHVKVGGVSTSIFSLLTRKQLEVLEESLDEEVGEYIEDYETYET